MLARTGGVGVRVPAIGRDRHVAFVVGVPGVVRVCCGHRRHREHEHQEARDGDGGSVEAPHGPVPADERDRAADDRDGGEDGGERVLEPDLLDGPERPTDVGDAGERPDRDAPRVQQHPGGDEQAVRAEHDEGGPAELRDRAEREHPRQGGLVAVTSGSRRVDEPGTGRRRGRGGEVGGKRPGRRVHTPILATNHELHVSSA